ncbi:MAG: hypothetical protein HYU30_07920 [Chloroflexi bacterium]|nr:hypothetical protein [Chloroflexota bacterium]
MATKTKKRIGTVVDEELLRRAKVAAAREGIPLSQLLERTLRLYSRSAAEEDAHAPVGNKYPLRGLDFTYINPTEPVAEKGWGAAS